MYSFKFLFDLPGYQHSLHSQSVAGAIWRQGVISKVSSEMLVSMLNSMAMKFIELGIKKGDRIIQFSDKYSIEWLAADMAIMTTGAISVPLQSSMRADELKIIIQNIEPVIIIFITPVDVDSLIYSPILISLTQFLSFQKTLTGKELKFLETIRFEIDQDDIATIVHTSGSSGEPRAIALSHQNLISNLLPILSLVPFIPGTRVISFLPLSHIFERIGCYVYLASGCNIYFIDSYRYALAALKDIRPDYFTCVPLILERFAAIMEERIEEASWFTRWAYNSWEKTDKGVVSHFGSFIAHQ